MISVKKGGMVSSKIVVRIRARPYEWKNNRGERKKNSGQA